MLAHIQSNFEAILWTLVIFTYMATGFCLGLLHNYKRPRSYSAVPVESNNVSKRPPEDAVS